MEIWSHRGSSKKENTFLAFQAAYDEGIRRFETDIHATADGVLVLSHDPDIRRMSGKNLMIRDISFLELQKYPILQSEPWCTLDELVAGFPEVIISIDIKSDYTLPYFTKWVERKATTNLVLGSFSHRRVQFLRDQYPKIPTALTPIEVVQLKFFPFTTSKRKFEGKLAMVPFRFKGLRVTTRGFIRRCRALGIQVHVWTVNTPEMAKKCRNLQVDGIITDNCKILI
jgi:glycerophosphoryl diester phosphodiesterase